ncbi:hypothetical protein HMPREF3034_01880 [Prevotella sp. DNF00663]|uniref:hypothetical protein n=1 Tax=unclassified Prevotella TaxID=2638335 RepID=UPI0005132DDA|nr:MULTISPECIES: hypothetical protein [unclassified Prevotella]KGI61093.1 hypothetical protein HMPREF0671_02310 [Prevotella sp. S7 MS 2]KXB81491.1 hypothetical protein HMPREF3034_01880 [Prevotella sp. DNF00663]
MDIIKRNLFAELRIQHFASDEKPEPMSRFKQKRLEGLLANIDYNNKGKATLSTPILNRRLKHIQEAERHAIDTSMETLDLLNIIVSNINATINSGISIKGIILLGQYLRTKGDKVDFIKLEQWLRKLHISRMAQLQGSILIQFFGFEIDEIPFVEFLEKDSFRLMNRTVTHTESDQKEEWHFRQDKTGFVHNNPTLLRKNLRRSIRYVKFAPIETISNFIGNFARSLSEIEE